LISQENIEKKIEKIKTANVKRDKEISKLKDNIGIIDESFSDQDAEDENEESEQENEHEENKDKTEEENISQKEDKLEEDKSQKEKKEDTNININETDNDKNIIIQDKNINKEQQLQFDNSNKEVNYSKANDNNNNNINSNENNNNKNIREDLFNDTYNLLERINEKYDMKRWNEFDHRFYYFNKLNKIVYNPLTFRENNNNNYEINDEDENLKAKFSKTLREKILNLKTINKRTKSFLDKNKINNIENEKFNNNNSKIDFLLEKNRENLLKIKKNKIKNLNFIKVIVRKIILILKKI
jgi:hypothetical protein